MGHPLPGVALRLAELKSGAEKGSGAAGGPGGAGMIEVRGPNVFQGYWQMPEKTAALQCQYGGQHAQELLPGIIGHILHAPGHMLVRAHQQTSGI